MERALADCEQLIHSQGATSGVDRIHTAFHGYLQAVCSKSGIAAPRNAGVTQLFKAIREEHPGFRVGSGTACYAAVALALILDPSGGLFSDAARPCQRPAPPLWCKRGTRKSRLETKTENEASSALLARL